LIVAPVFAVTINIRYRERSSVASLWTLFRVVVVMVVVVMVVVVVVLFPESITPMGGCGCLLSEKKMPFSVSGWDAVKIGSWSSG
jgi:hypothetical protein